MPLDSTKQTGTLEDLIHALGPTFAERAAAKDADDEFVAEIFAALREHKVFSAMVPEELGGGGVGFAEMCGAVRALGRYCSSTALAVSMHQHLVATLRWNYMNGRPGEKPLRGVAANEFVLVSTGAGDWLSSKGEAEKVDGGFLITARKPFGSGGPAGDLLVTSAPYNDPEEGWQVLHFPVPAKAEGVTFKSDWHAMGMRGTGSNTVMMERVFVPEEAVVLRRPRGLYHPFWDVVLTVALPLIMSAYVGLADAAAETADATCAKLGDDGHRPRLLGAMHNELTVARLALADMIANANEFDFQPEIERANKALIRKTIASNSVRNTAEAAIAAVGAAGFFRKLGLERLFRDSQASHFHPLPEHKQHDFTGRLAMGLGTPTEMDWEGALPKAAE